MKPLTRISALLAFGSLLISASHAAPPEAFAACAVCHTSDGTNGLGPSIKGVYGRKSGTARGFTYSPAMKRSSMIWDDNTLDAFIAEPQKSIPGNLMPFPGVADTQKRAEIIDYLRSVK